MPNKKAPSTGAADPRRVKLSGAKRLKTEVVDDVEAFRALKPEWSTLLDACPDQHPFLTWEWLFAWWKHFGNRSRLNLVVVRDGAGTVAILPMFAAWPAPGLRVYETLGDNVGDYGGVLFTGGRLDAVAAGLRTLMGPAAGRPAFAVFHRVRKDSPLTEIARDWSSSADPPVWLQEVDIDTAPYVVVRGGEPSDYQSSSNRRRGLGRLMRRLSEQGTVRLEIASDPDAGLDVQLRLQRARMRQTEQADEGTLSTPAGVDFLRAASRSMHATGQAEISFLALDGKPISAVLGFHLGRKYFYYRPSFDPEYASFGPGRIHIYHLLQRAIEEGYGELDLMRGAEDYKSEWTPEARELVTLFLGDRRVNPAVASKVRLLRRSWRLRRLQRRSRPALAHLAKSGGGIHLEGRQRGRLRTRTATPAWSARLSGRPRIGIRFRPAG